MEHPREMGMEEGGLTCNPTISPTFFAPVIPFCQLAGICNIPFGAGVPNLFKKAGYAVSVATNHF